jgi:hypothetical protein
MQIYLEAILVLEQNVNLGQYPESANTPIQAGPEMLDV